VLSESLGKKSSDVMCPVNSSSMSRRGMVAYLVIARLDKLSDVPNWSCKNLFRAGLRSIITQCWIIGNSFKNLMDLGFKGLKYLGRVLSRM